MPICRKNVLALLGCGLAMLLAGAALYFDLTSKGIYPPGPDQEEYLAAGAAAAEKSVFFWKAPLYSAWLGMFYLVGGKDLKICFFLEKTVSVILLAVLIGVLVGKLFDKRTGGLAAVWVLSCKYLLLEPNNSHTLTACLLTTSAITLLTVNRAMRVPLALLLVFLSTLVRSEMWLPLTGMLACLAALEGKRLFRMTNSERSERSHARNAWLVCCVAGVALSLFFSARRGSESKYDLIDEAFAQNFAANYVERRQLANQYPDPWGAAHDLRDSVMPGAKTLLDALMLYPSEVLAHVLYNVRISLRAIPSMLLGIEYPGILAIAIVLYLVSYLIVRDSRPDAWRTITPDSRRLLTIWGLSCLLLVINSYVFRVAARYYIQIIPLLLVVTLLLLRAFIPGKVQQLKTPRSVKG